MVRTKDEGGSALERLRQFGLRYPGAHTKSPWPGHLDLAVNDKTFAYLSIAGEPPKVSCKLPRSADAALELPFATPTEYGLGKSGWVTARFPDDAAVPVELLEEWIDESYRAQAPKRLSAGLPPFGAGTSIERGPLSDASVAAETDDGAPGERVAASPRLRTPRSTMKRESPRAAAASGRLGGPGGVGKAAKRGAAVKGVKGAPAASAPKAKASARRGSKREPVRAASPRRAKRDGVSPRAARRPAKKKRAPQRA